MINTFSARSKIVLALLFICTAAVALAAGPPPVEEVPDDQCEAVPFVAGDPDYPETAPDDVIARSQCSRTAKKYRISDDSDQVCNIKTCCRVVWDSVNKRWRTICKDSYVNCETIIIN